jgi:hypothetical protein
VCTKGIKTGAQGIPHALRGEALPMRKVLIVLYGRSVPHHDGASIK